MVKKFNLFAKKHIFGLATQSTSNPGKCNLRLLENIIKKAQEKMPLLNSIIMTVSLSSCKTFFLSSAAYSQFVNMKIVIISIIFYYSAYQNNSS